MLTHVYTESVIFQLAVPSRGGYTGVAPLLVTLQLLPASKGCHRAFSGSPTSCGVVGGPARVLYSACAYMQTCTLKLSSHVAHSVAMWRLFLPPPLRVPHPPSFLLSLFGVMLIEGCQWLRSLLLWDVGRVWEGWASLWQLRLLWEGVVGGVHGGMGKRL